LSVCGYLHSTNLTFDFETVQLHQLEKRERQLCEKEMIR
jgi:hypothetical protein